MSAKTDIAGFVDARSSTRRRRHRCEAVGEDAHDRSRWRCVFGCSGADRLVATLPYPLIDENRVRASIPAGIRARNRGNVGKQARISQPCHGILPAIDRCFAAGGRARPGSATGRSAWSPGQPQAGDGRLGHPAGHVVGPGLADHGDGQPDGVRHPPARHRHAGQVGRDVPAGPCRVRFSPPSRYRRPGRPRCMTSRARSAASRTSIRFSVQSIAIGELAPAEVADQAGRRRKPRSPGPTGIVGLATTTGSPARARANAYCSARSFDRQ